MNPLFFENDYSEGASQEVLQALIESNGEKLPPYGTDRYSISAREKIRLACQCPEADVFFLCGGTQTNRIVIDALLNKYQAVVSADTGHINLHEAGAVESAGHKVIALPSMDGKLSANTVQDFLSSFFSDENRDHMAFPGMVYISYPTEYGTLYSRSELEALAEVCHAFDLPLFLDGARLGYGLAAASDMTLADIARICDVFYIGGTKVGALCGEAVVFTKKNTPAHFMTSVKQNGALLAKGRLLGVQFDRLFTDDLYQKLSRNAIRTADRLRNIFREKGYSFYKDTPTNQLFVVLENNKLQHLRPYVRFSYWEKADDTHTVVRFATSWATTNEDIDALTPLL